jgi:hypothetical protein
MVASGTTIPDLVDDEGGSRDPSPPDSGTATPDCGTGIRVHVGGDVGGGAMSPVWPGGECGLDLKAVNWPASSVDKPRTWVDDAGIDIGGSRATSPPESGTTTPDCGTGIRVHLRGECGPDLKAVNRSASPADKLRIWLDDTVIDIDGSRTTLLPESGTTTPDCGTGIRVHVAGECGLDRKAVNRSASPARKPRTWRDDAVIDIGGGQMQQTLHAELDLKFLWKYGVFQAERVMPSSVLHDEQGLMIWPLITRLHNYYQTKDEIALLETHGVDLAMCLEDGVALVDLGCG